MKAILIKFLQIKIIFLLLCITTNVIYMLYNTCKIIYIILVRRLIYIIRITLGYLVTVSFLMYILLVLLWISFTAGINHNEDEELYNMIIMTMYFVDMIDYPYYSKLFINNYFFYEPFFDLILFPDLIIYAFIFNILSIYSFYNFVKNVYMSSEFFNEHKNALFISNFNKNLLFYTDKAQDVDIEEWPKSFRAKVKMYINHNIIYGDEDEDEELDDATEHGEYGLSLAITLVAAEEYIDNESNYKY